MRNVASLQEFCLLGQGRILLGQLPEKHRRELNSARRLASPPGLAGQGQLRLELAPAFQGPARGGMLPPSPFHCKHGFGWAPEAAVKKSGPVWERSRKKQSVARRGSLLSLDDPSKDCFFPSLVPERGREVPPDLFCFACCWNECGPPLFSMNEPRAGCALPATPSPAQGSLTPV